MSKTLQIAYVALGIIDGKYWAVILVANKFKSFKLKLVKDCNQRDIINWLDEYAQVKSIKFNALGICGLDRAHKLATALWLKLDIVPHVIKSKTTITIEEIKKACWKTASAYDKDNLVRVKMGARRRVIPSYLTDLQEYQKFFSPD